MYSIGCAEAWQDVCQDEFQSSGTVPTGMHHYIVFDRHQKRLTRETRP